MTLFNSGPQNEKIKARMEMDPLVEEMNLTKSDEFKIIITNEIAF